MNDKQYSHGSFISIIHTRTSRYESMQSIVAGYSCYCSKGLSGYVESIYTFAKKNTILANQHKAPPHLCHAIIH